MPKYPTKLAWYLDQPGAPTIPDFAKKVGADRARINRCAKGERRPGIDLAIAIERETGGAVPVSSWSDEEPWDGIAPRPSHA